MSKPERLTYDDVSELLELIQLCWMRAPDRFNHPEQTAEAIQTALLKLAELRQIVLQRITEQETPINLVLYICIVLKMLTRKQGLTGSSFVENLQALEHLAAMMAQRHKESLQS